MFENVKTHEEKKKAAARKAIRTIKNLGLNLSKAIAMILFEIGRYFLRIVESFGILQILYYVVNVRGITTTTGLYTIMMAVGNLIVAFFAANKKTK